MFFSQKHPVPLSNSYTLYIHIWRQLQVQFYLMATEKFSNIRAQIYPASPGIESRVTRYALLTSRVSVTLQRQTF